MIKVGVIGLGMGVSHLSGYRNLAEVKIQAICDLNKELLKEYAKSYDVPLTFTDCRKMLELEELDAVSIALPNYLHYPVTLDALEKKKHVLVEKPIAMNSLEAEKMVAFSLPEIKGTVQSHFIDCVSGGRAPEVPGEKGLAVMKVIDAIYESARIGKEVRIPCKF